MQFQLITITAGIVVIMVRLFLLNVTVGEDAPRQMGRLNFIAVDRPAQRVEQPPSSYG